MTLEVDLDLAPREGDPVDEPPADVSDEDAVAPTSDPDPAATEADFGGRPLTDDEVAALPVQELDGT